MDIRRDLDRKIEKKREEIVTIERTLGETRAYLQALEDTRKMLPKDSGAHEDAVLRAGTDLAKVREVLEQEGKPLHVDELLKRIGKAVEKKHKTSLSGSLAAYARDRKIFTRPAPNTFGLAVFDASNAGSDDDPPEDFGVEGADISVAH